MGPREHVTVASERESRKGMAQQVLILWYTAEGGAETENGLRVPSRLAEWAQPRHVCQLPCHGIAAQTCWTRCLILNWVLFTATAAQLCF